MLPICTRIGIGLLLIVHGFAHYKVTTAWGVRNVAEAPLLSGLGLSPPAIQAIGDLLWVLAMLAFIIAGTTMLIHPAWWRAPTIAAAVASIVVIGLYWMPSVVAGALVDLGVLVGLLFLRWPTQGTIGAWSRLHGSG
jgi:hypothetical protein